MSVVQHKWPNQYDHQAFAKNDYREHYIFGDPILTWDESIEDIQFLGTFYFYVKEIFLKNLLTVK